MNKSDGSLEQVLRVLRRRKLVILIALVCVPLAAYVVSSSKENQYKATATLLFESEEGGLEANRVAATNEILAQLPVVAVKTSKQLEGTVSAGEILESIESGTANEMANLTTISATTGDPELSATIANAYSKAYIEFRGEAAQKGLNEQIEKAESEIEALSAAEAAGIRGEKLRERLDSLELEKALRTEKISIVQPAATPTSPSSPKVKRDVLVGLVLGLLLGLGLAVLLERTDRRIRSLEELEEAFGLPVLAKIPKAAGFATSDLSELLHAPEAEAFRTLRTNLRYFNVDAETRVVLIASPEPADGKSTVARGLAGAMAQLGDNVVLVEADLRKASSLRAGRGVYEGLSTVLAGGSLDSALVEIPIADGTSREHVLWALASGPVPPSPPQLLESENMRKLIDELSQRFDVIILDSPALGYVSDALALIPLSTEVLAVGGLGRSKRDDIAEFRQYMQMTGREPIGLVATMTHFDRSQYSYYMRARRAIN